jgi:hypothetical protein
MFGIKIKFVKKATLFGTDGKVKGKNLVFQIVGFEFKEIMLTL